MKKKIIIGIVCLIFLCRALIWYAFDAATKIDNETVYKILSNGLNITLNEDNTIVEKKERIVSIDPAIVLQVQISPTIQEAIIKSNDMVQLNEEVFEKYKDYLELNDIMTIRDNMRNELYKLEIKSSHILFIIIDTNINRVYYLSYYE